MSITLFDPQNWPRKERFDHYYNRLPCTYSMTVSLKIGRLPDLCHERKVTLYAALAHLLAWGIARHPQFRTVVTQEGVGCHDLLHPSYTLFHPEDESFSCLWSPYDPDFGVFWKNWEETRLRYGSDRQFCPQPDQPENIFNLSMIPWREFTAFNLNLYKGADYLLPIFTLGRFSRLPDGTAVIPLAAQVHHAVCDGFHLCRFFDELEERAAQAESWLIP